MKQPLKKVIKHSTNGNVVKRMRTKRHPAYGTSKLEEDFAKNFLDVLGLDYVYQFEAKDIKRFFDFKVQGVLIEIDGDYWHGNPNLYEDKELNRTQKKSKRVDAYKNEWSMLNGYPILRIWESDIRKNPKKVMDMLKKYFYKDGEIKKAHKFDVRINPKRQIKKK